MHRTHRMRDFSPPAVGAFLYLVIVMNMKKIIKLFQSGNVCVCGLRGRGKDMLFANVAVRRSLPYISNTDYGGSRVPFVPLDYDCGGNTYENFLDNEILPYTYPHADGTDIYLSDAGIYFPAQHCKELNKKYPYISTFVALSRQLGECNFHFNVQNLNRVWDKIREQSDIYIMCNWCRVVRGLVFQKVTIYEKYESAVDRVPPYRAPKVRLNNDRKMNIAMEKQRYRTSHGDIKSFLLIYRNKSKYDTRVFKAMLENAKKVTPRMESLFIQDQDPVLESVSIPSPTDNSPKNLAEQDQGT